MFKFFHRLFNPHCEHCSREERERVSEQIELSRISAEQREFDRHCDTCDVLQRELELLRSERDKLLDRIITPPAVIKERVVERESNERVPLVSRHLPFTARRQALEQNDRDIARSKAKHEQTVAKPTGETVGKSDSSVDALERELEIPSNA